MLAFNCFSLPLTPYGSRVINLQVRGTTLLSQEMLQLIKNVGRRSLLPALIFNSCPAVRQKVSSQGGQRFGQEDGDGAGTKGTVSIWGKIHKLEKRIKSAL